MVAMSITSVIVSRPSPFAPVAARIDVSYLAVWSNFEVADMDFWRAPAYTAYVDYLEASGGFYYEVRTSLSLPPVGYSLNTQFISGGVMHQSTALEPLYSRIKTKSTSSMRSGMSTHLISTALENKNHGRTEGVVAILAVALVSFTTFS
jgi:hypothetical protein